MNGKLRTLYCGGLSIVLTLTFAMCAAAQTKGKKLPTTPVGKTNRTTSEQLPRKLDAETAVSPVYALDSKNCRDADDLIGDGDEFGKRCKGFGEYVLRISGFGKNINYGVESSNRKRAFTVMLFPLETGDASGFVRADQFRLKLADQIEWRLDQGGKPFAVIVRAEFYKNTRAKKSAPVKTAEFYFVRGLSGFEDLQVDVPTANTAYNPLEQARQIAARYVGEKSGAPHSNTKEKRW